ncbi:hypothetical protein AGMMS49983_14410 [Clostridia bacterium]|nr:hypothetical protein AGMMS49983_14410 [Clostridia bacterium]
MIRIITGIVAMVFLVGMLGACGDGASEDAILEELVSAETPLAAEPETEAISFERSDEDGLVTVLVEDGVPTLSFNVSKWEDLYQISEQFVPETIERIRKESFPLVDTAGRSLSGVIDACIATVDGINNRYSFYYDTPTVLLLMEDGTVENVAADPYYAYFDDFGIAAPLPYLSDIISLSYERVGEEPGEDAESAEEADEDADQEFTIFATDKGGVRYDARIVHNLGLLMENHGWTTILEKPVPYAIDEGAEVTEGLDGFLVFNPDGTITWDLGVPYRDIVEKYAGTYKILLGEGRFHPPGSITIDLDRIWSVGGEDEKAPEAKHMHGIFVVDGLTHSSEYGLTLKLLEGDRLPSVKGFKIDSYDFLADSDAWPYSVQWESGEETAG